MPDPIDDVLEEASPALELLFLHRRVPPARAAALVARALEVFARKRKDIAEPAKWLVEMVLTLIEEETAE